MSLLSAIKPLSILNAASLTDGFRITINILMHFLFQLMFQNKVKFILYTFQGRTCSSSRESQFLPTAFMLSQLPSLVQRKEHTTFVSALKMPTVKSMTSQQHDIINSFKVRDGKGSFISSLDKYNLLLNNIQQLSTSVMHK